MTISIFGLGYVGAVAAGCLSEQGHEVVGVDTVEAKVLALNQGRSPIPEPGLETLIQHGRSRGLLRATADAREAVESSEITMVCVGTPSLGTGGVDLTYVQAVCDEVFAALEGLSKRSHTLILRSTLLPGMTRRLMERFLPVIEALETEVLYCPEFLREGSALYDFREPSLMAVATGDGEPPKDSKYQEILGSDHDLMCWEDAELLKFACNYFHAMKVAFANEIGRIGEDSSIDSQRLMEVFCKDTRLNTSAAYLRPGNPFGGSCLRKDVTALCEFASERDLSLPLLESVLPSNESHLKALLDKILETAPRHVCLLGLAFKDMTDDLRSSPMVSLTEALIRSGVEVSIYDPKVDLTRLTACNRNEINERIPNLGDLLFVEAEPAIRPANVIVAAHQCLSLKALRSLVSEEHHVIDVNGWPELKQLPSAYHGFCR